ncbi:MAG TPA: Uma2 family endonuclease [Tepidiformaceae bacterium]|nr:Uma2 family endonuclease [Tepidiformaceae bacterium]
MATKARVSLADYLALKECKPYLELIDGEVVQKSAFDRKASRIAARLIADLGNYLSLSHEAEVDTQLRHLVRTEEWAFLPDVSVTLKSRVATPIQDVVDPVEVLPDLAIEVLSPDDQPGRVSQKIAHYMASGVRLLWVIDPEDERITVWEPGKIPRDLAAPAVLSAAPVLAGFELDLAALFARLHV